MITYYYKSLAHKELQKRASFKAGSWIAVVNPTEEEKKILEEQYAIDEDFLTDALDPYESPRMDTFQKKVYVFIRVPITHKDEMKTLPLLFVLDNRFLATISKESLPYLTQTDKNQPFPPTTQTTKFFLHLLSLINKEFTKNILAINKHIRAIKGNLEHISNRHILQFVRYEDILNDYLTALIHSNSLLEELLSKKILKFYEDDYDLIEDITLNFQQLIELSKANLKTIMHIRDAYSTILNNNLNQTMKLLAGLTILLTIPTIIASFYGMNIALPLQHYQHAFSFITALTLLLIALMFFIFKKAQWF